MASAVVNGLNHIHFTTLIFCMMLLGYHGNQPIGHIGSSVAKAG